MSVSVEHAQLLLATPETRSAAEVGVTKADLQPSGSAIALTSLMALTAANFDVDGQVVALDWQQDTLTISVDAAAITLAVGVVDGRRGIPVGTGGPTITGSDILFQLSDGDWTVPLDSGVPTILGQDLILEDNRYFTATPLAFSPGTIVLSENAVVASAAPTIAGQDITLTWGQASAGVETASFDIDGQDITLNKSWSVLVDATSFDIDGQNIAFDWVVPATVVVESTPFSVSGSSFVLTQTIPITSTAISVSGQSVGRGDGTNVDPALFEFSPQNIEFEYDYVLGYAFDQAEFSFLGQDIVLFLGSGAPTRFRSEILSDKIEIAFSKPRSVSSTSAERIRG